MADYQPLIARAVAGLERNTGEARRALYERARTALVAQLRGIVPALDESEITRERLALEEAIRKVEAETARRSRFDQPKPEPTPEPEPEPKPEPIPAPKPKTEQIAARPGSMGRTTPVASPSGAEPRRFDRPDPPRAPRPTRSEPATARMPPVSPPEPADPADPPEPAEVHSPRRSRPTEERPSLTAKGLKGFRDVMAEPPPPVPEQGVLAPAAPPPAPPAPPPPTPPPELASVVPPEPVRSRPEPERHAAELERQRPEFLRPPPPRDRMPRGAPSAPARDRPIEFTAQDLPDYSVVPRPRPPPAPPPDIEEPHEEEERVRRPPRSYRGLVRLLVVAAVLAAFAGAGAVIYTYPGTILAWVNPFKSAGTPVQTRDVTATRPNKIPDRVVGPGLPEAARPGSLAGPAVAQRVVLYEDDPGDPQGKQYIGSAIWRTELVSPGPGLAPELAVRADVEIPERRITMAWSIRRNTDQNLPASHTIEIMFNLPADFPHGGISNVPGIMMKQAEATRGTPLAGLAVKVTTGYFLIGLSAVESDLARNVQLLKERAWFDVPVLYNDNRRAIIAIEKGNPGDRAFADAFAAWGTLGAR